MTFEASSNNRKNKLKQALDVSLSSAFTVKYKEIIVKFENNEYKQENTPDEKLVGDLKELINTAVNLDSKFLPYASVTAIVYRTKNVTDLSNYSQQMKLCMETIINGYADEELNGVECVIKLMEHFDLATNQMNDLYSRQDKEIKEVEKELRRQNELLKNSKNDLEGVANQVEGVENVKGTIYTEFITILGIFSAFIFGIFGSFQAINTTLQMFEKNKLLGKPLMMTSVIMMSLMIVLYMFISWLGFIIGRPLKRECYVCAKNNKIQCTHVFKHLLYRHIGFSVGVGTMSIIFIIGLSLALFSH